jgi:hypothetical protein
VIAVRYPLQILHAHDLLISGMHLFGGSDTMRAQKGLVVVRVGIFDDVDLEKCRPTAELYPQRRPKWLCALENAEQLESMPPA